MEKIAIRQVSHTSLGNFFYMKIEMGLRIPVKTRRHLNFISSLRLCWMGLMWCFSKCGPQNLPASQSPVCLLKSRCLKSTLSLWRWAWYPEFQQAFYITFMFAKISASPVKCRILLCQTRHHASAWHRVYQPQSKLPFLSPCNPLRCSQTLLADDID